LFIKFKKNEDPTSQFCHRYRFRGVVDFCVRCCLDITQWPVKNVCMIKSHDREWQGQL